MVLLVSVGVHIVAGIGAGIWVVARYFAKPEAKFVAQNRVEMKPEERQHRQAMDQLDSMRARPVLNNRIQSLKPSALVLPDLPKVPVDAPIPIAAVEVPTNIGSGNGNGQFGTGSGNGEGFFGAAGKANTGLLEGVFYDLKQSDHGTPTDMASSDAKAVQKAYYEVVLNFVKRGMQPSGLNHYFQAPNKLYLSQVGIPHISAKKAPDAFKVKAAPSNWVAVYRATVSPPEDGVYRFAGEGDDALIVRFNRRIVLDGSLTRKNLNRFPMSGWKPDHIEQKEETFKDMMLGDWITMRKGGSYPIEILIGEQPGGGFDANIYIQKKGVEYATTSNGLPILPLFRVKDVKTEKTVRPVAEGGPIFTAISPGATTGGF